MNRRREENGVTGALLLVGLGVLFLTGWWWPGVMVVLGIAVAAGLIFEGRYASGLVAAAIFFAIPLLVSSNIPWGTFAPLVLIGLGVIALTKALFFRQA